MGRLFEVLCGAMGCAVTLGLCGETRGRKIHHKGTESTEAFICTLITIPFALSLLCFHLPSSILPLPLFIGSVYSLLQILPFPFLPVRNFLHPQNHGIPVNQCNYFNGDKRYGKKIPEQVSIC